MVSLYRLLILKMVLSSTGALAFDFHGVKSGMNRDEVANVFESLGLNRADIRDDRIYTGIGDLVISPSVKMFFDHQGKLYKLQLHYGTHSVKSAYLDPLYRKAFFDALVFKFGGVVTGGDGNIICTMTDEALENAYLHYLKDEYVKQL